ncbi:MAG: periplasmic heavy metal sensor [Pseudomonadota bacterium]
MTEPAPPKPGRGLRIALIVSLALNLLIVGAIAGLVLNAGGRRPGGDNPGFRAIGLGPVLPALPREDRRALFHRLGESRADLARQSRPLGDAMVSFVEALRAEPFDRDAAAMALDAQRRHGAALQEQGHEILLDQLDAMTAEARAEMADRLEASLRRVLARGGGPPERSEPARD